MNEQKKYDWMVSVQCMTFNHASFIVETFNGFTMQETTFPYVCVVVDDASTDGEQEIIKNYLDEHFDLDEKDTVRYEETDDYCMTFARHRTNKNCFFAVCFLKYNHHSLKKSKVSYLLRWHNLAKYVALCEGDDYWIHPDKLQLQVDYLEENPECNMVYTHYKEQHGDIIIDGTWNLLDGDCLKPYLLRKGFVPTASVMYRTSFKFDYEYLKMKFPMGDVPIWIQLMHASPIKLLPEVTTVYRILTESASHSANYGRQMSFIVGAMKCRLYFAEKYGYDDVCKELEEQINTNTLLQTLFNGKYYGFICSMPWKHGIGLRQILGVLKLRYFQKGE